MSGDNSDRVETRINTRLMPSIAVIAAVVTVSSTAYLSSSSDRSQVDTMTHAKSSTATFTSGELNQKPVLMTTSEPVVSVTIDDTNVTATGPSGKETTATTKVAEDGSQQTIRTYSTDTDGNASIGISITSTSENSSSSDSFVSNSSSINVDTSSDTEVIIKQE